jgi:hypothetical protein
MVLQFLVKSPFSLFVRPNSTICNRRVGRLTGLAAQFGKECRARRFAWPMLAVLCMLLTTVQASHLHTVEKDADHCSLCLAMQAATPVAILATIVVLVRMQMALPLFEPSVVILHRHPKLYTRPPPYNY